MGKHAKPARLPAGVRGAARLGAHLTAATALAGAGMIAASGVAAAEPAGPQGPVGPAGSDGDLHNTNGVVNINDNHTQVNLQACNNNVPVNVGGVQVPVEDVVGAAGGGSDDVSGNSVTAKNCEQDIAQVN